MVAPVFRWMLAEFSAGVSCANGGKPMSDSVGRLDTSGMRLAAGTLTVAGIAAGFAFFADEGFAGNLLAEVVGVAASVAIALGLVGGYLDASATISGDSSGAGRRGRSSVVCGTWPSRVTYSLSVRCP